MTASRALADILESRPLLLDGAVGTELERRGAPTPAPLWSAAALDSHPLLVEAIHRDYADAGADIIVANTFRTGARALRAAGLLERGKELNRKAIELARRAVGSATDRLETGPPQPVLIAASVAPVEDCYSPDLVPEEAALDDEHARMMSWLKPAEPDLVWIETMNTVREARAAARAASLAGFPFAVSFVAREDGALLSGERLEDAVAAVEPFGPLALGLNCIPPTGVTALLPRLRAATDCPLAAYAHINNATPIAGWSHAQAASPAEYARQAAGWSNLGARIVGGCCGTTPAHIRAIRDLIAP